MSSDTATAIHDEVLLTEPEAARLLRISPTSLKTARCREAPNFPPCLRVGRLVRYRRETILRWLEECESAPPKQRPAKRRGR